jgi:curved DNA-binding protein CbpA
MSNKEESYVLYKILGVEKDATEENIRKAYKVQAFKFHPDRNSDEKSKEIFQRINQAY